MLIAYHVRKWWNSQKKISKDEKKQIESIFTE